VSPRAETQERVKQLYRAQQDRGLGALIRGHHSKIASSNRRTLGRKPLGPNKHLPLLPATRGAICAAEMKDKRQVFDHLVNTSLLTAPMFSETQAFPG
jgi:hypothetical protein